MTEGADVDVSFLVPTLNRGRYVLRAVGSCLRAAEVAGLHVEVIVVDSRSDDGSWEALAEAYDMDVRVVLRQNDRDVGPTGSWLEAARLARGRLVTFVWSDDYVTPEFLQVLAVAVDGVGTHLALGDGIVREVDCEDGFAELGPTRRVPRDAVLQAYLGRPQPGVTAPVSPACALFSRAALDDWTATLEVRCRESPLRERLMWRSAIGPDLLLFAAALGVQRSDVPVVEGPVVQFSRHAGSITVGSDPWPLLAGYWLARVIALEHGADARLAAGTSSRVRGRLLLLGLKLLVAVPPAPVKGLDRRATRTALRAELRRLAAQGRESVGLRRTAAGALAAFVEARKHRA